jgi:DNA-binding CsgD family transcriptional regulator
MRRRLPATAALFLVVAAQILCSLFFVWDIAAGVVGLRREPMSWETRELIEIGASIGLVLGVALGAALLVRTLSRNWVMEGQLRQVSGAFAELLEERFAEWGLTRAERDVAWFTIKGLSIAEIARLRHTSEGTVKAHSNAIYRKAQVSGRTQLVSLFIEDLMAEAPPGFAVEKPPVRAVPESTARGRAGPSG